MAAPKASWQNDQDECNCVVRNREEGESQREWFKRWMCMFHWMQTDYYKNKLVEPRTAAGSLD